jgi:hypothetical protein
VKTPRAEDPNPSWFSRHSGALFVGGFGLVFTVAGLLIWFVAVPSASARAAAAEALSVVVPGHVPSYLEGVRVLLEAPIAVDVPEVFRDFVAFRRREFRGWKEDGARRREQWETKEIVAPAIALGSGDLRVFVVNPDYEMKGEPHQWRSTEGLEYSLFGSSTQDVVGFRRGDLVTIDGVLERRSRQPGIRAATMAGGDAATYRAGLQESVAALQIVGPIFRGVGGILFVGGLISLCRRRK